MNTESLINAIEKHDLDLIAIILSKGADPNTGTLEHPTSLPLHIAVEEITEGGSDEVVGLLLRYGAFVDGNPGKHDATPLLLSIMHKLKSTTLILLTAGADPNYVDSEGTSPLFLAIGEGNLEIIAMLLRFGATKTINETGAFHGMTPLGWAAKNLNIPLIKLLLFYGAGKKRSDVFNKTAIEYLQSIEADTPLYNEAKELLK